MPVELDSPSVSCALLLTILLLFIPNALSHGDHPGKAGVKPTGFHDSNVVHDTEHIMEHYEGQVNLSYLMTNKELEFHYFKLHDFDNNAKLDGLEIYYALTHLLPYKSDDDELQRKPGQSEEDFLKQKFKEEHIYYTDVVDNVLKKDDTDKDGYLTYVEYIIAQRATVHHNEAMLKAAKAREENE